MNVTTHRLLFEIATGSLPDRYAVNRQWFTKEALCQV